MYTDSMQRAFRSLDNHCPKGFWIDLIDNEFFITVRVPVHALSVLNIDDQRRAAEYVIRVKSALEDNGAIVLLTREANV